MSKLFSVEDRESLAKEEEFIPNSSQTLRNRAAYLLSDAEAPIPAIGRAMDMREAAAKSKVMIEPDDAWAQYDLAKRPDRPMNKNELELAQDRWQRTKGLQNVQSSGPDSWNNTIQNFGWAALAQGKDPLNLASGYAVGAAFNFVRGLRYARQFEQLAEIAGQSRTVFQTMRNGAIIEARLGAGRKAVEAFAENLIGNMAMESLAFEAARLEQQNYTVGEAFMNAVAGSIIGAPVLYGAKWGMSHMIDFAKVRNKGIQELYSRMSISHVLDDKKIDFTDVTIDFIRETDGKGLPYQYLKLSEHQKLNKTLKGFKMYAATVQPSDSFKSSHAIIGKNYGRLTYLSDNPNVVNAEAARGLSRQVGNFYEVKFKEDMKLIDLDSPFEPDVMAKVEAYLEKNKFDISKQELKGKTGAEILDMITEDIGFRNNLGERVDDLIEELHDEIAAMGKDGYYHNSSNIYGVKHGSHNNVMLFDADRVEQVNSSKADPSAVNKPDTKAYKEKISEYDSPKNDSSFDPEMDEKIKAIDQEEIPETLDMAQVRKEIQELDETIDEYIRQGSLDQADADDLKAMVKTNEQAKMVSKAIEVCLR